MAYSFKHGERPLDDYTIQRAVGSGGFGEVYYAVSDGGREVALKYLRNNPQVELRGVGHCINLKSPHLVSIFDVKKNADGDYFVIMEYCSGPSLRDLLIAEPNGFAPEKAAFFVREVAKGLSYLHDRGIVHRDLKPGNIFYDDGYVKIGDYGLSKFIAVSRHSAQTASVGTVHYMAPEIGSGNYSHGVDIYALGVMLYEMLLGKVPFEGSSMAEILMKHLTSQPEVEDLPEPFGRIIRKALEKDPKDRYQSVDEMVDDLLSVDTVQTSLAGFAAQSLEGAVRQGATPHADAPLPSPNPVPGYAGGADRTDDGGLPWAQPITPPGGAVQFPPRLARQMERISNKVEQRVAKLSGHEPPRRHRHAGGAALRHHGPHRHARAHKMHAQQGRGKMPAILLTLGLAIGLGFVFGNTWGSDEVGASAGMLTAFMAVGVGLSRKMGKWFGGLDGPRWSGAVIRILTCTPLLFLGAAPMLESKNFNEDGLAVVLGLIIVSLFANWDRNIERGAVGELGVGGAMWRGFLAAVACSIVAMFTSDYAHADASLVFMMAGAVTAAATIIVQANAWWLCASKTGVDASLDGTPRALAVEAGIPADPPPLPESAGREPITQAGVYPDHPGVLTEPVPRAGTNSLSHVRERSLFARGFWSLAAFGLMGGVIVTFLVALLTRDLHIEHRTGAILGCVACGAFMLFALRKTTAVKRDGFWRETLRPFLLSLFLFGVGGTTTAIARYYYAYDYYGDSFDMVGGNIAGLSICSFLLICTFFLGRKPRKPRPFLRDGGSGFEFASDGPVAVSVPDDVPAEMPASPADNNDAPRQE